MTDWKGWLVCDGNSRGEVCLFSEWSGRKLERCIRHGAILNWYTEGYGKTRAQIKAEWHEEAKKEASRRQRDQRIW